MIDPPTQLLLACGGLYAPRVRSGPTLVVVTCFALHGSSGCALALPYPEASPEICGNERDDDVDGAIDCADSDCDGSGCDETEALCFDERDNDRDGRNDWRDPGCFAVAATTSFHDCSSIEGGQWELPPDLGVLWVAERPVRSTELPSGDRVLLAADLSTELRSRPVTTGRFLRAEVEVELRVSPRGGLALVDLVGPSIAVGAPPQVRAGVIEPGRWRLEVLRSDLGIPFVESSLELEASTEEWLSFSLHMLGGRPSTAATWEIRDASGVEIGSFSYGSERDGTPLVLRVLLAGEMGLASASITRISLDACDGTPRPPLTLRTEDTGAYTPLTPSPRAALEPDGAACALLPYTRQWRRFPRRSDGSFDDGEGELLRTVPVGESVDVDAMYIDPDTGELHAISSADESGQRRLRHAVGCAEPWDDVAAVTGIPDSAVISGLAPAPEGGHEVLFVQRSQVSMARSSRASPEAFGEATTFGAAIDGFLVAQRVGADWIGMGRGPGGSFALASDTRFAWRGIQPFFASVTPAATPGQWVSDGNLTATFVLAPDGEDRLEGLWLQSAYARGTTAGGLLVSSMTVRRRAP